MKMHPHRHPFWVLSLCFVIATTLILIRASMVRGADDVSFLNCSSTIQCGNLQNVSYPFWGLNRASYCGLSEFELTCQDNMTPLINISNQDYRVLRVDSTSQMTVVRNDYWNTTCPTYLVNSTQDFPSPFNYTADTVAKNLTLYYGCQAVPNQIASQIANSQFTCSINKTDVIGFFLTKNASDITSSSVNITAIMGYFGACNTSVVLAANQSAVQEIESTPTSTVLVSAIDEGFGLQWTVAKQCSGCLASGGQCGRDNSSGAFTCYCQDKSSSSTCSDLVEDRDAHIDLGEHGRGSGAPQGKAYRPSPVVQTRRSLTLSRTDLNNNTCLQQYANTTLNSTVFPFASDDENLTLFYGCSTMMTLKPRNLFSCEINGTETDNYYLLGASPHRSDS
ncbi:hypothetical protein NL676_028335 [Syzygium grande]|nr:hypothetical protein NL676_028335 [Syzygium grande]